MLYHVLSYNKDTCIAKVVDAALYGNPAIAPSSFHVSVAIDLNKVPSNIEIRDGMTYSFILNDTVFRNTFVRGELDYSNPLPRGSQYGNKFSN